MKMLFVPAVAWCVSTSCFALTEEPILPSILVPVATEVVEAPPEKGPRPGPGERLDGLRKQLGGLAESLEETGKAVEEMARQRDAAREEAKQSKKAQRMAMEEMLKLRNQLEEARKGGREWKLKSEKLEEKVKAGAMAHEELQKFRGELQGALKEFAALKGDLGKARSEIQDPVERAALKKEAVVMKEERKQLGSEIEMALQAKQKGELRYKEVRIGLEKKLQAVTAELKETKGQLEHMAKMKVAKDTALNDLGAMRMELAEVSERSATMKLEFEADERDWLDEKKEGNKMMDQLQGQLVKAEKDLNDSAKRREEVAGKLAAAEKTGAEMRQKLGRADERLKEMEKDAEKPHQALKRSEESRRKAMEQVREANVAAGKIKTDLATLKKAKVGLEELLFRKTDEVRELKAKLKKLEKN